MWSIALKLLYTVLLVGLIGVLAREFYFVWFDDRVFVGRFNVIAEGGGETVDSAEFARRVVSAQAVLSHQLSEYQRVGEPNSLSDATFNVAERERISLPDDALKGIEITIQNINLTQIFSTLRKGFSAPNEIHGHVTSTSGSVLAAVEWPRAPAPAVSEAGRLTKFYVPAQGTLLASAKYIACSLSWARGAAKDERLARIPRVQFCEYAMALGDLYDLNAKASTPKGLSDEEVVRVRRRIEVLASHYNSPNFMPDIYRLRADLIDLLPDRARSRADLVEGQEDRLSYAMLSPKVADLPPEEKRYTVLALARPAIPLPDGKLRSVPGNWRSLLSRHAEHVERAVQSTALLLVTPNAQPNEKLPVGTAFMVAPNLALTASHVIQGAMHHRKERGRVAAEGIELCFGDHSKACTDTLKVSKIHYSGDAHGGPTDIALLEVDDHSPVFHPPLPLIGPDPAPNTLIGGYAFVIGYSFIDRRMPELFVKTLLGKSDGFRRIIPGRILAFNVTDRRYTSDISTTAGTSGGPLVDLSTGAVLALSFAGEWRGGRGKFAYALQIPQNVRAMIDRRIRGEVVLDPDSGAPAEPQRGAASPDTDSGQVPAQASQGRAATRPRRTQPSRRASASASKAKAKRGKSAERRTPAPAVTAPEPDLE